MTLRVDEWCVRKGITLEVLIELSGLDDNHVRAMWMGRWTPSPQQRETIAAVLEVAVDEVAWGHATPIQHIYGQGPG